MLNLFGCILNIILQQWTINNPLKKSGIQHYKIIVEMLHRNTSFYVSKIVLTHSC